MNRRRMLLTILTVGCLAVHAGSVLGQMPGMDPPESAKTAAKPTQSPQPVGTNVVAKAAGHAVTVHGV